MQINDFDSLLSMLGSDDCFRAPQISKEPRIGIINGLGYSGDAMGSILSIESTSLPGSGKLNVTGNLGKVISESVQVACVVAKSMLSKFFPLTSANIKHDLID